MIREESFLSLKPKKVSTFILMNELLLLIPPPFMISIDRNGKMAVTSHLSSKEAGLKSSPG